MSNEHEQVARVPVPPIPPDPEGGDGRRRWEDRMFRLMVENVKDYAIFVLDADGRVETWNEGAEVLLGFAEAEIVGRSADIFFTPDDRAKGELQREMRTAAATGRGEDDCWHVRKDGSRFWCSGVMTPLLDPGGKLRGFAKIMRDQTQWKRSEEIAREGERLAAFEKTVGHALTHGPGLRETLARCAEAMVCHLGVALARIWTLNEPDGVLELQASAGLYTHTDGPHGRVRVGQFKIGLIAQDRTPHLTNSVVGDPRVHDQEWARREGLVAFAGYPLVVEDRVVGVVAAFARHPLTDATLRAMASVAGEIALAVLRRRAEEALRASEERFRRLSESGFVSIAFFTPDGGITEANDAFLRLTGHSREDLVAGRVRWDRLTPPEWMPRTRQAVREFEATGRISPYEKEYLRSDGTRFWGLFGGARLEGGSEGVAFVLDITERKRAEALLLHSEERFRSLMEQAPFSIQVFAPDGRTLRVNRAWEELWGVTLDQIADYNVLHDPQLEKKGIAPYLRRAFAGEAVEIPAIEYDPDETIPDRTRHHDPLRWVSAVAYPLKDDAGRVREVILVHEDVTARHRAEAALRESEGRFRTLAEGMPHFVWVTDARGVNQYQNRVWYEYTGTPTGSGHGQDWLALYHPDDRPHLLAEWTKALESDGAHEYDVEVRIRRHDGRYRWFRVKGSPIRDAAGATVRWVGTCTDIHEQRRLLDALREADRRKDEFLATLAHELRNPLAPLRNGLQIMKLAGGDPRATERSRVMMERQVGQMARLIDDLMDVSRISRGKVALQTTRMRLAQAIGDAIETSRPLIERQGHELALDVPDEPIFVDGDATRLTQVFANLLNNAAKYTEPGGHIRLTVERQGGDVVVSVEDSGVGIPAHMLSKVFDLFSQVDRSLEKSQGGLGIGLSIVKRLVEMHGGSIEARSGGHGTGSTFVVRLPMVLSVTADRPDDDMEQSPPTARRRILVVDDNRDGAASLAEMLTIMGNQTQTADDGLEAVAVAEAFRPDVILLDIGMPKLNGYDACRRIRQQPWGRNVVIVAQTGWGQEDDKKKSLEAGFDLHMVKPVDPAALEKLLAESQATG